MSCSTYIWIKTPRFPLLKVSFSNSVSFSSSVSQETMADLPLCLSTATAYFGKSGKLQGNTVRPLQSVPRMKDATVF